MAVSLPTELIAQALQQSAGNITEAARSLGMSRTGLHLRISKTTSLQQVVKEEREALIDMAESALRTEILGGNMTAIIWALKASPEAKRRGWGERTELTGNNGDRLGVIGIEIVAPNGTGSEPL